MKNIIFILLLAKLSAQRSYNNVRVLEDSPWGEHNILSTIEPTGNSYQVQVNTCTNNLFVTTDEGISVYDVSNPYEPIELNRYNTGDSYLSIKLNKNQDTLFCSSTQNIEIIDVSDVNNFVQIGWYETDEDIQDIILSSDENYLYAIQYYIIQNFDISDPAKPKSIQKFQYYTMWDFTAFVLTSDDSKVLATQRSRGLIIIDVKDKTALEIISTTDTDPWGQSFMLQLRDDETAIVGNFGQGWGIFIFDISEPLTPVQIGYWQYYPTRKFIISQDRKNAYITFNTHLSVFNIENGENIELITEDIPLDIQYSDRIFGLAFSGDESIIYVTQQDKGIRVIETLAGQGYGISAPEYDNCETPDEEVVEITCDITTIYEKCGYDGESTTIDQDMTCLEWQPKSICVQPGATAEIYDSCYYEGEKIVATENIECFSEVQSSDFMLASQNVRKNPKVSPIDEKNVIHTRIKIVQ